MITDTIRQLFVRGVGDCDIIKHSVIRQLEFELCLETHRKCIKERIAFIIDILSFAGRGRICG